MQENVQRKENEPQSMGNLRPKEKRSSEWKTIGVKVRVPELPILNRQLTRLNYDMLGDLVKDLIAGKLTHVTEDQQIDIMKTNLQTSGQITGLSGKPYEFYKQIDIVDLHNYPMNIQEIVIEAISKNMHIYFLVQIRLRNCSNSSHIKDLGYFSQLRDLVITTLGNITTERSTI
jgi:hypothetical protein